MEGLAFSRASHTPYATESHGQRKETAEKTARPGATAWSALRCKFMRQETATALRAIPRIRRTVAT